METQKVCELVTDHFDDENIISRWKDELQS